MRVLAISAIVLVAVIMVIGAVAPALQQAFAHDVTEAKGRIGVGGCPENYQRITITDGLHPDHNFNGFVCLKVVKPCDACKGISILIDDSLPPR